CERAARADQTAVSRSKNGGPQRRRVRADDRCSAGSAHSSWRTRRMHRLLLLGMNHTTAPLELREKVALDARRQREAIDSLRARFNDCEVVLLSTCIRVEIYAARPLHGRPRADDLLAFVSEFHSLPQESLRGHVYEKSERDAIEHLFAVASSLD